MVEGFKVLSINNSKPKPTQEPDIKVVDILIIKYVLIVQEKVLGCWF